MIAGQADLRLSELLNALGNAGHVEGLDGMSKILVNEYEKGVRAGMLLVADLPRAVLEHQNERVVELRDMIKEAKEEQNDE